MAAAQQPVQNPQPSSSAEKPPHPRISEHPMHKNRLQEYVQRSALPLPAYNTVALGHQQENKFQSTVMVDQVTYTSQIFSTKKEAEQNAAKVALDAILKKVKAEGCPLIHEDLTFCKSILNEFATKKSWEMPTYNTTQTGGGGMLPVFISTVTFQGETYTGTPGRNKKEAEQLGARSVIRTVLGKEEGPILSQIVNTKRKLYAALGVGQSSCATSSSDNLGVQGLKKPKVENHPPPAVAQPLTPAPRKKNKKKGNRVDGGVKPGGFTAVQESACPVAQ